MSISSATLSIIRKLRLPSARSAYLLFPYSTEGNVNDGITVQTMIGEPAVAPGTGAVTRIYTEMPKWQTSDAQLKRTTVKHVVIDHGGLVTTVVGGLSNVSVLQGQTVYRGDELGDLFTNQLFISASINSRSVSPTSLNNHWLPQNGGVVIGQGGKIRFAPDRLLRNLANNVTATLTAGIKYFDQLTGANPLLINIAFNGDGSKVGYGAVGYTTEDYWNIYTPVDFEAIASSSCYYYSLGLGYYDFSAAPVLNISDYNDTQSPVVLERVAPTFSAASSGPSWDNMLKSWIGGWLGPVPYENTFRIRNIPAGNYELYLYANKGTVGSESTFYVSVNAGLPTIQANNPTVNPSFIEGQNYMLFSLTVPSNGYITLKTVGYLSGLQLKRV